MIIEEARDILQEQIDRYGQEYDAEGIEALEMAIRALSSWSMYSDELWKKAYVRGCNDVLAMIKAEIEQLTSRYSISKERGGIGQVEWSDRLIKESDVLQIINKYKAENEDKE